MFRWYITITGIQFSTLCIIAYLYSVALRNAGMLEGRLMLNQAAMDYKELGYVTNRGSSAYEVWVLANALSIGTTQYQTFITVRTRKFRNEGVLVLTTNQVFIWLDSERSPRIVDATFRAPLFPPRF